MLHPDKNIITNIDITRIVTLNLFVKLAQAQNLRNLQFCFN